MTAQGAVLQFELTVTNTEGHTHKDKVSVYVSNVIITGDMNDSGTVDLQDVIMALQVLCGDTPPSPIYPEAEANGDGRIGLQEVLYVLKKLSE